MDMHPRHQFKINHEKWECLCKLRSWKHPISHIANLMQYTRSYVSQVVNGRIPISHDFMLMLIEIAGTNPNRPEEWAPLFDVVKVSASGSGSFQALNQKKYDGKVAYKEGSLLGKMRQEDKARNLERLDVENPISAREFYQDHELAPSRPYYQRKFRR